MEEMVSTKLLTYAELTELIATHAAFFQEAIFLIEQLPPHVVTHEQRKELLRCERFDASVSFADYTSGRIFNQQFELCWEREHDKFRVVYVGLERDMSPLKVVRDLDLEKKESTKQYYLFGERLQSKGLESIGAAASEGDFAELRIPRLLHYPVKKPGRYVKLSIQEYVDKGTGEVALFRFQAIEAGG